MRFLLTLNMPSAQGFLVHQLTVEHKSKTLNDFCDYMNDNQFIIVDLLYRHKSEGSNTIWSEKGEIVLNTECIGKAQEFFEFEKDNEYEPGQVEAWQSLKQQYGEIWQPLPMEIS